jgi:hypothetical protein
MPNITLLSWNIEHLGPKKYVHPRTGVINPNANAILHTIAETAARRQANVISLLELSPSTSQNLIASLGAQLSWLAGGQWGWEFIATHKRDMYCILYRMGMGFDLLRAGNQVVKGYTNLDAHGNALDFHSRSTRTGGRRPGYVAFTTTDRASRGQAEAVFTVICYHAMFGPFSPVGLESVTKLGPVTTVDVGGTPTAVTASIIAGDFNVDMMVDPEAYADAFELGRVAVLPTQRKYALSSIINVTWGGYPNTLDYRASAYDNIFSRNAEMRAGAVIDMLDEFKDGHPLAECTTFFNTAHLTNGTAITSTPPANNEDAWHYYRTGISNHLPVIASATI